MASLGSVGRDAAEGVVFIDRLLGVGRAHRLRVIPVATREDLDRGLDHVRVIGILMVAVESPRRLQRASAICRECVVLRDSDIALIPLRHLELFGNGRSSEATRALAARIRGWMLGCGRSRVALVVRLLRVGGLLVGLHGAQVLLGLLQDHWRGAMELGRLLQVLRQAPRATGIALRQAYLAAL